MTSGMRTPFVAKLIPWAFAVIVATLSAAACPFVYGWGKRVGDLEARYDEMASRMPHDFRLMIALLASDHARLPETELISVRGRLKGTIGFAKGMVIPMERERGHQERAAELERLTEQAQQLDKSLGPIYSTAKVKENK